MLICKDEMMSFNTTTIQLLRSYHNAGRILDNRNALQCKLRSASSTVYVCELVVRINVRLVVDSYLHHLQVKATPLWPVRGEAPGVFAERGASAG